MNQSAVNSSALRHLPVGAKPGEFIAFVRDVIFETSDNQVQRLKLLWPVWKDVDQLVVARASMAACFADLSWTDEPESNAIARRLVDTLQTFPELELDFDASKLAIGVLDYGQQGGHHAVLAYILDPMLLRALERLLREALEIDDVDTVTKIVSEYVTKSNSDIAITKVLREFDRAKKRPPIGVLNVLTDALESNSTLAASALGKSLQSALENPASSSRSLGSIVTIARRAREVVLENRKDIAVPRRSLLGNIDIGRLRHVLDSLPPLTGAKPVQADARYRFSPGVVTWYNLALELGVAKIDAASFTTKYALLDSDGSLYATEHKVPEPFQYGPYCDLAAGDYAVEFLGEILDPAQARFIVTSDYGTVRHAAVSKKASDFSQTGQTILATLTFSLPNRAYCEFIIEPEAATGLIRSSGVRLQLLNSRQ